jgi:hypothetical protein
LPYLEGCVLTTEAPIAVVPDPLPEVAAAGAGSVDEPADAVDEVLAAADVLDAELPQAVSANAEPSASTIVGTARGRDTTFLLGRGICRYDPTMSADGANSSCR